MTRRVRFDFSGLPEPIIADVLDEAGEFADLLWEQVEEPLKMWTVQTVSTGDWFSGNGRKATHAQKTGTQAAPLGPSIMMSKIEQGSIVYGGHRSLGFCYGPDVTEPLPTHGPVVAKVSDLESFYRAGSHVCDSHFKTHQAVTVTASRA